MRRSKVLILLALLLVAAGACGDDDGGGSGSSSGSGSGTEPADDDDEGEATTLDIEETEAEVAVGDTVVIELAANPSVGDDWQLQEEPDGDVLELVDEEVGGIPEDCDGCGGTKTFTFEAVGEGVADLVVFNCYRCTSEGEPSETPPEPAEVEFTVEVSS